MNVPPFVVVFVLAFTPAWSQACPSLLLNARKLILVTAPTMDSVAAKARLFEREFADAPWRDVHPAEPAVLGRFGMAWGQDFRQFAGDDTRHFKREGDLRTPAGIYSTGKAFGFAPSLRADYLRIEADTVCVDDPSSSAYNTITSRTVIGSKIHAENMGGVQLYRRGLVIDYPTGRAPPTGSCVFIHVWRGQAYGPAGCIGLPERRVAAFQAFAQDGATVVILPEPALAHFKSCLPDVRARKENP
jgi:L,D-peptidoglycan transpeptidase YkuD (ErfK/YbiS/YcfS/YnhG family)